MSVPSSSEDDKDTPMTWLGISEVDCSAGLPPERRAGIPTGGIETEMTWLGMTEVDCSPAVEMVLNLRLADSTALDACSEDIADLLCALHEGEKALGGAGLALDRSQSRRAPGQVRLVLWPLDSQGAEQRLRQLAALLAGAEARQGPDGSPEDPGMPLADPRILSFANRTGRSGAPSTGPQRLRDWVSGKHAFEGVQVVVNKAS